MESKNEIYRLIPEELYPKTVFISRDSTRRHTRELFAKYNLQFPLIAKPDVGLRGIGVKKINNLRELDQYVLSAPVNFLIQEFIHFENEAGIFYYRFPNEQKGTISGIVLKEFLQVEGDGESTILQLLSKNKRHLLQLNRIKAEQPEKLNEVLKKGCKEVLVPFGNHSRGCKFIDASHLISDRLTEVIDSICQRVSGFYYGRLDIRFGSWEDLCQGKNFSIIELNGAGSEPTHIYDPKHSIFFAWKEIIRHTNILYKISKQNRSKHPFMNFRNGAKMLRENTMHIKLLSSFQ